MRSEIRTALAVLATAAVLMGSATMALAADSEVEPDPTVTTTTTSPSPSQSTTPGASASTPTPDPSETTPDPTTTTPTAVPSTAFEVTNAQFRWGVNNESNNRGAAPGSFNFFSAGTLGNPGEGGKSLTPASSGAKWSNGKAAGWKAVSGNVSIEKRQANGTSFARATWAGLSTDKDGKSLGPYASNTVFSDHQLVVRGGTGQVDATKKSATIRWKGAFTVVYYSGLSYFTVTNPTLKVTNGQGRISATLGGYASSMDDMTRWTPMPDSKDVVIADLGAVDLSKDLGFTASPKYAGVRVTGVDQNTSGQHTGSFPQSFINFAKKVGTAGYWHSTGGGIDKNKFPLPLAVSYDAGKPVAPPASSGGKTGTSPKVDNDAPSAPVAPTPPTGAAPQPAQPVFPTAASVPAPGSDDVLRSGTSFQQAQPLATVSGFRTVSAETNGSADAGLWILGSVLLAGAVALVASPIVYSAVRKV